MKVHELINNLYELPMNLEVYWEDYGDIRPIPVTDTRIHKKRRQKDKVKYVEQIVLLSGGWTCDDD